MSGSFPLLLPPGRRQTAGKPVTDCNETQPTESMGVPSSGHQESPTSQWEKPMLYFIKHQERVVKKRIPT